MHVTAYIHACIRAVNLYYISSYEPHAKLQGISMHLKQLSLCEISDPCMSPHIYIYVLSTCRYNISAYGKSFKFSSVTVYEVLGPFRLDC